MEENNYIIMCYNNGVYGAFRGFLSIDGKIEPNVYNSTFYTKEMADKAIDTAKTKSKFGNMWFLSVKYKKFNNQTDD